MTCFHMNKENIRDQITLTSFLIRAVAVPLLFLAIASGCRPDKPAVGDAALAFRTEMQGKLNMYSIALTESMAQNNRKKVNSILHKIYAVSTPRVSDRNLSLAVLDKHGVTVATKAGTENTGAQNYGNYQIVSRVLHKHKPFQSSLYLQGGRKVYIICSPLLKGDKVVGVLIIGIDSDQLMKSGISEKEFLSLTFNARAGGRR
jgi:hypothetical protein